MDEDDRTTLEEPPDTPAHLFAVKAFKTALFGTPAPPKTQVRPTAKPSTKPVEAPKPLTVPAPKPPVTEHYVVAEKKDEEAFILETKKADIAASPAKGILLTPGAGAARRKTVSFSEIAAKYTGALQPDVVGADDAVEDRASSPEPKDAVRRTLFRSKDGSPTRSKRKPTPHPSQSPKPQEPSESSQALRSKAQQERAREQEPMAQAGQKADSQPDITMDLEQPRSRSGKHWMNEYQREHDNSKAEMKNLIRHNNYTKSFAELRDQEATEFAKKLEEAESKLKEMEQRVSELASQLMDARTGDGKQEEILSQLAEQTAQALRYKSKAERFRAALWGEEERKTQATQRTAESTRNMETLRSEELARLRSEAKSLRASKRDAERQASDLVLENVRLKGDVARLEKSMSQLRAHDKVAQTCFAEDHQAQVSRLERQLARVSGEKEDLERKVRRLEKDKRPKRWESEEPSFMKAIRADITASSMGEPHGQSYRGDAKHDVQHKRRRTEDFSILMSSPATTRAGTVSRPRGDRTQSSPRLQGHQDASRYDRPLSTTNERYGVTQSPLLAMNKAKDKMSTAMDIDSAPPSIELSSRRLPTEEPAAPAETGRRSPIIPNYAKDRSLRHTKSASSLTPDRRPRTAAGLSPGQGIGNSWNRNRPGRSELPADRKAAALRRLEEKKAARAGRGAGKENERPASYARGLSSYHDIDL